MYMDLMGIVVSLLCLFCVRRFSLDHEFDSAMSMSPLDYLGRKELVSKVAWLILHVCVWGYVRERERKTQPP